MKNLKLPSNEIDNLVSIQLSKNTWPRWVLHLSLRYGHVILVSRYCYLVLTAVNWPWNGSPISNGKVIIDLNIFFHFAWLHRLINILRDYIWAREMVMWHWPVGFLFGQLSIDLNIQCHFTDVNYYVTQNLPSLHGWGPHVGVTLSSLLSGMVRDCELYFMLTMKKETLQFHNFYTWFWSVSLISIGYGDLFPGPLDWRSSVITDHTHPSEQKNQDKKLFFDGCQSSPPPSCVFSQSYKNQNPVFENCWFLHWIRHITSSNFAFRCQK